MTVASQDRSTRFACAADDVLPENLAGLWATDSALALEVERLLSQLDGGLPVGCHVQPSRSGPPTLAYSDPATGATALMHSRYDPVDEARKLADTVDTTDKPLLFVHGLGLGYHVEALFRKAGRESLIFVFEPKIEVLCAALLKRNLSEMLASNRVAIVTTADKAGLFARLMPNSALTSLGVATLKHAPSIQLAPREHAEFEQLVADFLAYAKTCVSTLVLNGKRTAENIIRNLPWYVSSPGMSRLAGAYAAKPAIIVSAGPSLRKNKQLLRSAQGNAVLISVQTTLKPMLELGIEPNFVTSLDYHDICTRFFENLPATLQTELVAEPKATDAIFEMNPGPLSILGNDFAESLLHEMRLNKARLPAGATVAHLAFYLAEHMGCDPIIFVGQDLGFSDGLCYAPGTSYEDVWRPELGAFCSLEMKQWEQIIRDRPILRRVPDHAGRPTYTEERLFTYLQHFERDFARCRARVIDATEGGVMKRGATPMPLAEAIATYCSAPLGVAAPHHRGLDWTHLDAAIHCLRRRIEETTTIASISGQTLPLLEEIRDHLTDQSRVNRAIARIDRLRAELEPIGRTYHLITQLTQQSELQRFAADRRIAASDIDPTERQRRQVMRDVENVGAIARAAAEFEALLVSAIERLESFRSRRSGRIAA